MRRNVDVVLLKRVLERVVKKNAYSRSLGLIGAEIDMPTGQKRNMKI
jgi:hypothetical protein